MNAKRKWEIAFIAVVLTAILSISLITLFSKKQTVSGFENRSLAATPHPTLQSVADGSYFTELERYCCDHAALRTQLLYLSTQVEYSLLRRPNVNGVVTSGDTFLAYQNYAPVNGEKIAANADKMTDKLKKLSETCESVGADFLYVAIPSHYAYFENLYPGYMNNLSAYTDRANTAFFEGLERKGVDYLDIGRTWTDENEPTAYMSKVDHHYTVYGALSVCRATLETANENYGMNLPVLSNSDFDFHEPENPYVGSRSRKLFGKNKRLEKLTYATPKTPVPFARYDNGKRVEDSLFALPENEQDEVYYTLFMGGDIAETVIKTNRPTLPKVLVFGDSFTNAAETLLYTAFDEMRSLDLRHYKEKSLREYIKEYKPDLVICMRDYEQLLSFDGNGKV